MPKRGHFPTPQWASATHPVTVRRTRYLFDDGSILDVDHAEHDGSSVRDFVLKEAARQWGARAERKIVGSTSLENPT